MNSTRCFVTALLLAAPQMACSTTHGAMEGVVVEAQTGKPLGNAFVIAKWRHFGGDMVGSRTTCPHVEVVQADGEGRYRIPAVELPALAKLDLVVFSYLAGYEWAGEESRQTDRMVMRPYRGTAAERISSFRTYGYLMQCSPKSDLTLRLRPLFRSVDDEGERLAARGMSRFEPGTYSRSLDYRDRDERDRQSPDNQVQKTK